MSLTVAVAPAAATVRHRRRRRDARTTHTLKVVVHDDARSPVDDDHPGFTLTLRRGESLAAGLVAVQFINKSSMMEHQATLARLHRRRSRAPAASRRRCPVTTAGCA